MERKRCYRQMVVFSANNLYKNEQFNFEHK